MYKAGEEKEAAKIQDDEQQQKHQEKEEQQIPGGRESDGKIKSPRDLRLTPKASDQARVSDNNKKTIAETNAVASKNA